MQTLIYSIHILHNTDNPMTKTKVNGECYNFYAIPYGFSMVDHRLEKGEQAASMRVQLVAINK